MNTHDDNTNMNGESSSDLTTGNENEDGLINYSFLNNPNYDLELFAINKDRLDLKTPQKIINSSLENYREKFTFGHLNTRSLPHNFIEFKELVTTTKLCGYAISETWLTDKTPLDRVSLENYRIYRKDRINKRGGGVAIYIKEQYQAKEIKISNENEIPEMLWLEVKVGIKKVAIGVLYRAPKIPYSVYENLHTALIKIYAKYEDTILLGDFNSNWLLQDCPNTRSLVTNFSEPFALTQLINSPTRITDKSRTLIDLIFVSNPQNVLFSNTCDVPGVSDHNFTYLAYSFKKLKFKPFYITKRNFKDVVWADFNRDLEEQPWENTLCVTSINDKVCILENMITSFLDKHAPIEKIRITKNDVTPWVTKQAKELMDARDDFKLNFNVSNDVRDWEDYRKTRNSVTSLLRTEQSKIIHNEINQKVSRPKEFYKSLRKLKILPHKKKRKRINFSAKKLNAAFSANNNAEVNQELINEQIALLYRKNPPCIHKFNFRNVDEREVCKIVAGLKSNSCGVDGINSHILKLLIKRLSLVITDIVNTTFRTRIFPDRWKLALVKPLEKVNFPKDESDFRPISLLCTISKIIEKIAHNQICEYINCHNLLDAYQSAYKRFHGCNTAHIKITDDFLDMFDDSELALLVLLDFSKAFDTVHHTLLLEKLSILGFQEGALEWVKSYLTGRRQKVVTDEDESDWIALRNGVPQGSILGPLLFSILVSDIRQHINFGSYHSYADDLQYYMPSKPEDLDDNIALINEDLNRMAIYCKNSGLRVNEGKTYFLMLGNTRTLKKVQCYPLNPIMVNKKIIERKFHIRNLGLTYDEVLSWNKHISSRIAKAMANFRSIVRFKRFLNMDAKKTLCDALVLSMFNFADSAILNISVKEQKRIQKMQNMCIRYIFNVKGWNINYVELRKQIGWMDMNQRRIYHSLSLLYKILNAQGPSYLRDMFTFCQEISETSTRNSELNLLIPNENYAAIHSKAFRVYIPKVWNLLPHTVRACNNVTTFKKMLKSHILNNNLILPPR